MLQLGLIGSPLGHSLSPWLHSNFLEQTELKGEYQLMEIKPENFPEEISTLKDREMNGFNVTVPFKREIIPFLDSIDDRASRLGAVNTVVVQNGKWRGYNTDGDGYLESVRAVYPDIISSAERVLIIGSGGAARGIAFSLSGLSLKIDVTNRTPSRAEELLSDLPEAVRGRFLTLNEAALALDEYDWVIQTTSVGMAPKAEEIPIDVKKVKENALFSDIVYRPLETRFLLEAKRKGARVHYGHLMLLYQAAYSFALWTNEEVLPASLITEMESKLEG
ncbi:MULTISPECIES: shikimate dehydrogenase [Salimicrobium]|uniref:Shikimate dehydrogenase (NADP(+)) n=3 Tax=Salimicrobium TaxID=351195 RepID=K2FMU6_9BACI|nr:MULTISPECIES: shikimate dehydrogenase [Salimicrobium]AKG04258.1 shikimate dehydrogenase [Salimicrobium jeotgali]EKE32226.1 shikimate 5-dehydrogenase [Salimicrobium jeotgali]MBM7695837.1 shikimate dehydrogenase [Salimicrobium jeotgali]SDX67247.1 shikimate dehydrogenase [Salimicrobium album]SIS51997.1 shikimate dehydrogenase [Salimicrobium salexigens]